MTTQTNARPISLDAEGRRPGSRDRAGRLALAGLCALLALSSPAHALLAGAASVSIETPVGAPLGGYGGLSERRSTGTLDLPEARVLVLAEGDLRLALVTLDIVIVRPALRDALIAHGASLGIPHVVVVATHTHSGAGGYLEGLLPSRLAGGGRDEHARARILHAAQDALSRAAHSLEPTQVGVGRGSCDLARNRRREDGPREHDLPVVRLVREDGTPLALLFAYGVHGVTLGPTSQRASADLIGVARRTLDARFGTSLFLPGPLGDQNPFPGGHGGWPEAIDAQLASRDAAGASLASAVSAVADAIAPDADARLAIASLEAPVPALDLADRSALWWFSPLLGDVLANFFSRVAVFHAIDLGAARLLSVPAEPSSRLGDALRRAAGAGRTPIVVAHADDWLGYALTPEDYETGGYEAGMSFFGAGFGDWLVAQSARAAARLDEQSLLPGASAK